MAIGFRGAGTAHAAGSNPSPSYPAGVVAGDLSIMSLAIQSSGSPATNATAATPSGWTLLRNTAETSPDGTSVRTYTWAREGAGSGSVPITTTSSVSCCAQIVTYTKGATEVWDYAQTDRGWDANGTGAGYSGTGVDSYHPTTGSLTLVSGDYIHVSVGLDDNLVSPASQSITVGGATTGLGTLTLRSSAGGVGIGLLMLDRAVTGTITAGTLGYSHATSTIDGSNNFVRLRAYVPQSLNSADTSSATEANLQRWMPVVDPRTWVPGDVPDADALNQDWRDNFRALINYPDPATGVSYARPTIDVWQASNHPLPALTHTPIVWDTEIRKQGGMFVNGSKIIVPRDGRYRGLMHLYLSSTDATEPDWVVQIRRTRGASVNYFCRLDTCGIAHSAGSSAWRMGAIPFNIDLQANDMVEMTVWRNGGGTNTSTAGTDHKDSPRLQLWWAREA